jgi:putative membrane protein
MKFFKNILLGILSNGLALYAAAYLVVGMTIGGVIWKTLLIGGIILGILNILMKPILKLFSLPFILLTAGLFYFVINAVILWILQEVLIILSLPEVSLLIDGWISYIFAGAIIAVVNTVLHWILL